MILRLTADQLRKLADQVDALTAFKVAGGTQVPAVLSVDDEALAYTAWWEDRQQVMAEFIDFTPGKSPPLSYHDQERTRTPG